MPGLRTLQRFILILLAALLVLPGCTRRAPEPPKPAVETTLADGVERSVPSADRVAIRYRVLGKGEPALIFIHGWSCDSTYWDAQLDDFSKHYTVVTLDLAGHGDSGTARADWSMDAFGDDVVSVVQQIPNRELVLVGHSMGGTVALEAARRLKGRVIGIVGVDTFGNIGWPQVTAQQLDARLAPFRRDFPTAMRDYVTHQFFTPRSNPAAGTAHRGRHGYAAARHRHWFADRNEQHELLSGARRYQRADRGDQFRPAADGRGSHPPACADLPAEVDAGSRALPDDRGPGALQCAARADRAGTDQDHPRGTERHPRAAHDRSDRITFAAPPWALDFDRARDGYHHRQRNLSRSEQHRAKHRLGRDDRAALDPGRCPLVVSRTVAVGAGIDVSAARRNLRISARSLRTSGGVSCSAGPSC